VLERATQLYNSVVDVFDWRISNEVITPYELALKQARSLPNRSGRVLVPCAGIGTYVLALMEAGFDPHQITAVEIDPAYARLGSGIFSRFGVTYLTEDLMSHHPLTRYTICVGNPPYQKGKYSDFYVCLLRRNGDLLLPGGCFSFLMPAKGVNPGSRLRPVLENLGWNRVEIGLEKFFPTIATVIAEYSGVKGSKPGFVTAVVNGEEFPLDHNTVLPLTNSSPLDVSITRKLFSNENKMPFSRKTAPVGDYVYVSRMVGTWHPDKPKGGPYALKASVNESRSVPDGAFVPCSSLEEAKHIQWLLTRSLVMRYAINQCGKAAFVPPLFWSLTPDLRQCTSDEDILEFLGLKDSEIEHLKLWESSVLGSSKVIKTDTIRAEIHKAKTRGSDRVKRTGEVFTPMDLCLRMVRDLPEEKLSDPSSTYLDNTCGDGNFLDALLTVLTQDYGHDPKHVLNHQLYGVDLMPDNIAEVKRRLGVPEDHPHYVCADALTYDYSFEPTVTSG